MINIEHIDIGMIFALWVCYEQFRDDQRKPAIVT